MDRDRILDEIHKNIREMRGELKDLHKEVIILKTEKKVGLAFLTVIVSTVTSLFFKFFDSPFK